MDDIPNCDWAAPSVVRRGELALAISTGGASPAVAKKLRLQLSAMFGEEWAEVLSILREVRGSTLPFLPDIAERASRWAAALDTAEAVALVREGRADDLRERLVRRLLSDEPDDPADERGIVYLVGAGPGDPKLITVRGAEVLGLADVVVYDRLASPALLDLAPSTAERIYVGKEPGRSATPQLEIDRLLVDRALRSETVVRLKGGDPFVFGRGGEEMLACARAGVPYEVDGRREAPRDMRRADRGGTPRHRARGDLQWAGTPEQRTIVGTLEDLPVRAAAARIGPPATLVVGHVVGLAAATAQVGAPTERAVRA